MLFNPLWLQSFYLTLIAWATKMYCFLHIFPFQLRQFPFAYFEGLKNSSELKLSVCLHPLSRKSTHRWPFSDSTHINSVSPQSMFKCPLWLRKFGYLHLQHLSFAIRHWRLHFVWVYKVLKTTNLQNRSPGLLIEKIS